MTDRADYSFDRTEWRGRLKRTYPWFCPICKTLGENEETFRQIGHTLFVYRHSECGHVIMYTSGTLNIVKAVIPTEIDRNDPNALDPMRKCDWCHNPLKLSAQLYSRFCSKKCADSNGKWAMRKRKQNAENL